MNSACELRFYHFCTVFPLISPLSNCIRCRISSNNSVEFNSDQLKFFEPQFVFCLLKLSHQ